MAAAEYKLALIYGHESGSTVAPADVSNSIARTAYRSSEHATWAIHSISSHMYRPLTALNGAAVRKPGMLECLVKSAQFDNSITTIDVR